MPIKVFYGDDRERALREVERFLGGAKYETIEGAELTMTDLPNIFQGTSLLATGERRILLKDVLAEPVGDEIAQYAATKHRVAILEMKVNKRTVGWKKLAKVVECTEYKLADTNWQAMFDIYRTAKRDGRAAVEKLRAVRTQARESKLEPKVFIGVLASGALRDYEMSAGASQSRACRVLKELAKLDLDLGKVGAAEASPERPWLLIEGFLTRMAKI